MSGTVVIDCFPEHAARYQNWDAIVVVDVIRATTTATTAVSLGRRVFPVQTTDEASIVASTLKEPLLVGELGGNMPYGFDITNSPAEVARRTDTHRPMVLVSSSGTQLLLAPFGTATVYIACLRNFSAAARHLRGRHERVAILGAGTRGQFRREDQIGCAWVAEALMASGYGAEDSQTGQYVSRWSRIGLDVIRGGRSAEYLVKSGQQEDLEFILSHVDDLAVVPALMSHELIDASPR